jgi:hypothetical protein
MDEGCQKSKTIYTVNFKCEAIQCAEGKGNHRASAIFGVNESNV